MFEGILKRLAFLAKYGFCVVLELSKELSGPLTTTSLLIKIQSDVSVLIEPALFCHTVIAILNLSVILVRFAKNNGINTYPHSERSGRFLLCSVCGIDVLLHHWLWPLLNKWESWHQLGATSLAARHTDATTVQTDTPSTLAEVYFEWSVSIHFFSHNVASASISC